MACRNLFCWGWWRGLRPYYTLKLKACQRLIVGWNLEHCQYLKFSSTSKPITDGGTEPWESSQTRSSWLGWAPPGRSVRLKKQVAIRDQAAQLYHIEAITVLSLVADRECLIRWPGYLLLTGVITSYSASACVCQRIEAKLKRNEWTNKSLRLTRDGALSSTRTRELTDVTGSARLSSGRSAS